MNWKTMVVGLALGALAGCGNSDTGTAATAPTTQERVEQHLKEAGQEIKAAATEAATEMKPAIEKAKTATEDAVHRAAEKVSEMTSSRPATQP